MGDIVVAAFRAFGAVSVVLLAVGALMRSRALLVLGASLLGSVILTWILGLLGFPVGIVFGFLGTGALFRRSPKEPPGSSETTTAPPGP